MSFRQLRLVPVSPRPAAFAAGHGAVPPGGAAEPMKIVRDPELTTHQYAGSLLKVKDLALRALRIIAEQGEGLAATPLTPPTGFLDQSHFARFLAIYNQFPDGFNPARPVPTNPNTTEAPTPTAAGGRAGDREPLLEIGDIQGNVLVGFNKDYQQLLGLRLHDVAAARRWLARVEPELASTAEVLQFRILFQMQRDRRGRDPAGMVATWANIAFSAGGLRRLTSDEEVRKVPDRAFLAGLLRRSANPLHDPSTPGAPGAPDRWVVGGPAKRPGEPGGEPDVLLIIASDDPAHLRAAVARLRPNDADGSPAARPPEVVWEELGETRRDLPGHEHFGFKDGISQPGVRGLIARDPDVFLEPRVIAPGQPGADDLARPGQPLVWPGHFVLGYPAQSRVDGAPLPPLPLPLSWLKNGSFLVFRRLSQNVRAFRDFVRDQAAALARQPGLGHLSADRLAAMLIGRWPSGAPLLRAPGQDDVRLGQDEFANNHFEYETSLPPLSPRPGSGQHPDAFPPGQADPLGLICPHAAHVRKVNPRDQDTELGDRNDTLTRRILRRGIPFGPPLPDPTPAEDPHERGLHFLCYQASIEQQFEVIMQNWANAALTPKPGGHDPIIGQNVTADGGRERYLDLASLAGPPTRVRLLTEWVTPTGGGYFFAPSLTAIRDRLCRVDPHA